MEREELRMEKFFQLNERGTNVRTEIIAGITTFLQWLILSSLIQTFCQLPAWIETVYS